MSPEQARGEEVDRRTDIWSLGVVLYEMISGKHPFPGEYEQAVVYEILNQDPEPLTSLRTGVPMEVENVVDKCLQKDKKYRYQHADDLIADLGRIETRTLLQSNSVARTTDLRIQKSARGASALFPRTVVGGAVLLIALSVLVSWFTFKAADTNRPEAIAAMVDLLDEQGNRLEMTTNFGRKIAIAPDGSRIVFSAVSDGMTRLFVKDIDSYFARPIPGTEDGFSPAFSPDGSRLAFCNSRSLMKVDLDGGLPEFLTDIGGVYSICGGVTWLSNEVLVFVSDGSSGLERILLDGSSRETLTEPDSSNGEISHRWPHALPDQKGVVFTVKNDRIMDWDEATIALYDLDSDNTSILFTGGTDARVLDQGVILYESEYSLKAAAFNLERREVVGAHQTIVNSVDYNPMAGYALFDVSNSGTLIYLPAVPLESPPLIYRTSDSILQVFDQPYSALFRPRFGPNDQQAVVEMGAANNQIIKVNLDRPELERFTRTANNYGPEWTPDGEWITFVSDKDGSSSIYRKRVDSDSTEPLYTGKDISIIGNWTSDGKRLVFTVINPDRGKDIWMLTDEQGWTASPLLETDDDEYFPQISPDGSLLLHLSSTEAGQTETFVRRVSNMTDKRRLSVGFGDYTGPMWDDSNGAYILSEEGSLSRIQISGSDVLQASTPEVIFPRIGPGGFDVSADGQTFLVFTDSTIYDPSPPTELRIESGWVWLKELVESN